MAKGHYRGGSTLLGRGKITSSKGRSGGIGLSGAAEREKRRVAAKKLRAENAAKIKVNEKIVKQLGREWAAEKGRKQYEGLVLDQRVKTSPLAAALRAATAAKDES